ncbi:uncharacterized protein EHS24_000965 [Apiotrichum porosum]|uniref:Uncharacterized protein n=1 Tax=Apiotrichum porosum TaxID=105984 RepID=A0A427YBB7_9TREE|nr:uncharacterized protein EHS24_000965 [Apiotrichum porosum]RSH88420.1 hypothetical protein EHS24_000965 [Apiotrichum porosum]
MRRPPTPGPSRRRPSTTHTHMPMPLSTPDTTPSPTESPTLPITPHHPARPRAVSSHSALPSPMASIQKYSDALRRALSARFEAVALAGQAAVLPEEAATDPDYGYDEDPFDTRARLLLSFAEHQDAAQSSTTTPPVPPLPTVSAIPPTASAPPLVEHVFDLSEAYEVELASPRSPPRRWSMTSSFSNRDSFVDGAETPNSGISVWSEASFEAGRSSDYVSLYGRPRSVDYRDLALERGGSERSQRSVRSEYNTSERRSSLLAGSIRPLTVVTPSPQPRRLLRRPKPYDTSNGNSSSVANTPTPPPYDTYYETPNLARTTSESMILAAGLAVQRSRPTARA